LVRGLILPSGRTSSFGGATGSDLRACASIYFRFSSLLGIFRFASYGKKALASNISKTVTDTTMESMETEYETDPGLPIGAMTLDLG